MVRPRAVLLLLLTLLLLLAVALALGMVVVVGVVVGSGAEAVCGPVGEEERGGMEGGNEDAKRDE